MALVPAMHSLVIAVIVPETLQSVGEWYDNFSPTTDEEVRRLLGFDKMQRASL